MTLSNLTAVILLVNVVFLIAYDVWVKLKQLDGKATISWVTLTTVKHVPIIAVAIGIVIGHLFWQNCDKN